MRVELPPRLTTLVGSLSLTGHLGTVRDKTTLAVPWLRQRSYGDPAGTEGWGRVGFCLITISFQHHIMLKVRGGDGLCINLGGITKKNPNKA